MIGWADRQTLIARRSRNRVRSQASTTHGFGTLKKASGYHTNEVANHENVTIDFQLLKACEPAWILLPVSFETISSSWLPYCHIQKKKVFLYDVKLSFSPKGLWSCHCRMRGDVSNKSLERHDDPRVETRRSDWGKARYLADSSYSAKTWLTQTPRVDLFLFAIVDMQSDV
jgi:hypothetical protein